MDKIRMITCRSVLTIVLLMLGARAASASDGQILITQEKALAGAVTPGDGPGFPITITAPGSYKLASDLAPPPDISGIIVTSEDVTIDFDGFTLNGSFVQSGTVSIGILGQKRGLTVRNGGVRGFLRVGIYIGGDMAIIENMRLLDNHTGVYAEPAASQALRVTNSVLSNGYRGVECGWACHVDGSTFFDHGNAAVFVRGAGLALGNTIVHNRGWAIYGANWGNQSPRYLGIGDNSVTNNLENLIPISGSVRYLTPNACAPEPCP